MLPPSLIGTHIGEMTTSFLDANIAISPTDEIFQCHAVAVASGKVIRINKIQVSVPIDRQY